MYIQRHRSYPGGGEQMVLKFDEPSLMENLKSLDENEVRYFVDIDGRLATLVIDLGLNNRILVVSYKDNYEIESRLYNHADWEFDAFDILLQEFWRNREIEFRINKPA